MHLIHLVSGSLDSYRKQCELLFFFPSIKNTTRRHSACERGSHENLKLRSWPNTVEKSFAVFLFLQQTPQPAVSWSWLSELWIRTRTALTGDTDTQVSPAACGLPRRPVWTPQARFSCGGVTCGGTQGTVRALVATAGLSCSAVPCPWKCWPVLCQKCPHGGEWMNV